MPPHDFLLRTPALRHPESVQEVHQTCLVLSVCPVRVEIKSDGQPRAFTWRGRRYHVLHINEPWHLTDRWWVSAAEPDDNGGKGYSDRYYYRVSARERGARYVLWCDLYHDRAPNVWMLEKVLD